MALRRLPNGARSKAIAMMIEGSPNRAIASAIGVHTNTVMKWRNDPDVKTVLDRESMALIEASAHRMRSLTDKAISALESVLDNDDATPNARVAAAESILKRTGIDALLEQHMDKMRAQTAPSSEAQAAFNALVDEEVARREAAK